MRGMRTADVSAGEMRSAASFLTWNLALEYISPLRIWDPVQSTQCSALLSATRRGRRSTPSEHDGREGVGVASRFTAHNLLMRHNNPSADRRPTVCLLTTAAQRPWWCGGIGPCLTVFIHTSHTQICFTVISYTRACPRCSVLNLSLCSSIANNVLALPK